MSRLRKYLANGLLMTLVALALRGLGVAFNAYITKKIGAEALGLYTLLGSVYSFDLKCILIQIKYFTIVDFPPPFPPRNNEQLV